MRVIYVHHKDNITVFAHEAAHALADEYHARGVDVCSSWQHSVGITRERDEHWRDPQLAVREALPSGYATFDYTRDEPENTPEIYLPEATGFQVAGIAVRGAQANKALRFSLLNRLMHLTPELRESVDTLVLIKDRDDRRFFVNIQDDGEEQSTLAKYTEALAVHTQYFYGAYHSPTRHERTLRLLLKHDIVRERLDFLAAHCFIQRDKAKKLKSEGWLRLRLDEISRGRARDAAE